MRLGIFGGSFDPIHIGHLIVAQSSLEKYSLDKVIFVPAKVSPFKVGKEAFFSEAERFEMVKLAIEGNPKFEVSDFEICSSGISYTYLTVDHFSKLYEKEEIFLIVGGDSFESFCKWKRYEEIISKVMLIVYPRGEVVFPEELKKYKNRIFVMDAPSIGISSTEIRNRIKSGKEVRYFLPCKVYDFLLERGVIRS